MQEINEIQKEFENSFLKQPKPKFVFIQPRKKDKYLCNVVWNDKQYFTNSSNNPEKSNIEYIYAVSNIWYRKIIHLLICSSCFCFVLLLSSVLYSSKLGIIILTTLSVLFFILAIISRIYHTDSYKQLDKILTTDCSSNEKLLDPSLLFKNDRH